MKSLLTVENFLANREAYFLVDVRSPGEFNASRIPGAINVPLFSDEERALVGTTYCQEGTDQAKLVGLSLISPRLPTMVAELLRGAAGREIVVYCWRGGMRSRSVFAVMEALGYPIRQLVGGYKAFRRQVVTFLNETDIKVPVFVLNGLTGVGKTLVIKKLQAMNAPALDLEGMANHRGSAFGAVGLGDARSQKDFEAYLFLALREQHEAPYLIVEGEGKRIGPVIIPDFFFAAMIQGYHLLLEADIDVRVERILEEYRGKLDNADALATAVYSLQKKLGKEKCEALAVSIRQGDYKTAATMLCTDYYDMYYRDSRQAKGRYLAVVNVNNLDQGTGEILALVNNKHGAEEVHSHD